MKTTQPDVSPTGRYGVNDTARALGVCKNTVLNWLDNGILRYQVRKSNGRRYVTGMDIIQAWHDHY